MNHPRKEALDNLERHGLVAYGTHVHEYYKHLLSLSSGALTLLVALKSSYVPEIPLYTWALQLCWASLALCILFSLLLLWGRAQSPLDEANNLRTARASSSDAVVIESLRAKNGPLGPERVIFSIARHLQTASFLIAVVSLTWFAISNV